MKLDIFKLLICIIFAPYWFFSINSKCDKKKRCIKGWLPGWLFHVVSTCQMLQHWLQFTSMFRFSFSKLPLEFLALQELKELRLQCCLHTGPTSQQDCAQSESSICHFLINDIYSVFFSFVYKFVVQYWALDILNYHDCGVNDWQKIIYLFNFALVFVVIYRVGGSWSAPSSSTPWPGLDPSRFSTNGCGDPQWGQQQPGQRGVQLWSPPWGLPPEQPWVWGTARQLRHGPHGHEPVWLSGMQMLQ